MTKIKPTDLPEHRARMLAYYGSRFAGETWERLHANAPLLGEQVSPEGVQSAYRNEVTRWRMADLFWVSEEMTELAKAAARTMPTIDLRAEDLPAPYGAMHFAAPMGWSEPPSTTDRPVAANDPVVMVAWGITSFTDDSGTARPGVWLSFYTDSEAVYHNRLAQVARSEEAGGVRRFAHSVWLASGPYTYDDEIALTFGDAETLTMERHPDSHLGWACIMVSTWLLMQQRVASESPAPPPERASRRRIQRMGHDVRPVRVITLRHVNTGSSSGTSDREYHHQWVVKGHWRNQWYPKQERHIPIWISPHVKGPEGAPLLGGEKVYAWTR